MDMMPRYADEGQIEPDRGGPALGDFLDHIGKELTEADACLDRIGAMLAPVLGHEKTNAVEKVGPALVREDLPPFLDHASNLRARAHAIGVRLADLQNRLRL